MESTRNQQVILERASGDTLQVIGDRHAISLQRVQTIVKDARRHVDKLELDLLAATKTDELVALIVPNQEQGDRQLALNYLDWVLAELRGRDIEVEVEHRPTVSGSVFFLSDVTQYGRKV